MTAPVDVILLYHFADSNKLLAGYLIKYYIYLRYNNIFANKMEDLNNAHILYHINVF